MIKRKDKIKVLAFGHIPKSKGGLQSSGLANVIWELASNINSLGENVEVELVSTDIFEVKKVIDNVTVYGWNKKLILSQLSKDFKNTFFLFILALKLKVKYKFSFYNTYAKLIFFQYNLFIRKYHIIHIHGINNYFLLNNLKINCTKKVLTLHGITGLDIKLCDVKSQNRLEKMLCNEELDCIVFVTKNLIDEWEKNYCKLRSKVVSIINGYDDKIFFVNKNYLKHEIFSEGKIKLLTIGGIGERKGQKRVLEAISLLEFKEKYSYTVIGEGDLQEIKSLATFAEKNGIEYQYMAYQSPERIAELLHYHDYMILPSSSEGFGLVFLESIACGTQVILPKDLPIVKEKNILSAVNSILIEDCSSLAISETLKTLTKSTIPREEVAKTIQHIKWRNIATEYVSLFNKI